MLNTDHASLSSHSSGGKVGSPFNTALGSAVGMSEVVASLAGVYSGWGDLVQPVKAGSSISTAIITAMIVFFIMNISFSSI